MSADAVIDQWDVIADAAEFEECFGEAALTASASGALLVDCQIHVVPCVPDQPVPPGARVTGIKVARVGGRVGIYLFAEADA